ncbi:MAG: M56 family metallopeptidase [Oscillospiraceae bacterium]|nr:M56 family metallopeptidase [Oscillospiraceae bacterium]
MVEWIITSSALIAVLIAVRYLFRGRIGLRLQYALWLPVLLRLLIPATFGATPLSVLNAAPDMPEQAETISVQTPASYSVQSDGREIWSGFSPPPESVIEEARQSGEDYSVVHTTREVRLAPILRMVWLAGIPVMGLLLLLSNLRFAARLKRTRRPLELEGVPLPVWLSDEVETPCLFGLLRPAVYITPETAADSVWLRHAAEHELNHYRQGDHVWSLLRCLCLMLHWYNPLVWIAALLSRRDAELSCDEATVRRLGEDERAEYGRTLIAMTCRKRPALLRTATTMTGSAHTIRERIVLLARKPKTAAVTLLLVLVIAAVAVGCTFTGARKEAADPGKAPETNAEPAVTESPAFAFSDADDTIPVELAEELKDLPAPVTGFAAECVRDILHQWNDGEWVAADLSVAHTDKIIRARIVGLDQVPTGTAGENWDIRLYRLSFRLLTEHSGENGDVVIRDGETAELIDGRIWLTERSFGGQPCLLLMHYLDTDVWTRVAVTTTQAVEEEYGTPELLERYGDAYTAAAMELSRSWREAARDRTPPATDRSDLLQKHLSGENGTDLTLFLADTGDCGTYHMGFLETPSWISQALSGFELQPLKEPPPKPSDYWLTADDGSGGSITFWHSPDGDVLQFVSERGSSFYRAAPSDGAAISPAESMRRIFDGLEVNREMVFPDDGGAEEAAERFVRDVFPRHMTSLSPGSWYGVSEYRLLDWEVTETDGDACTGEFRCAVIPAAQPSAFQYLELAEEGEGEYDGWLILDQRFTLQEQEGGRWRCASIAR